MIKLQRLYGPLFILTQSVALLSAHSVFAQSITNQTNLFIPQGLELHLDGDFVNEGFIQNNGSFFITGSWTNTNVYQGIGSLTLNGGQDQSVFNNKNAVYDFRIDGTGMKYITDLLPVSNRLELTLGVVSISDRDTLRLSNGASIVGGSTVSYVDGALTHEGAGYKFFPIGKNGGYYPVELLNITGIQPVTEMEIFELSTRPNVPATITPYSNIYWQRKTISGTFTSSPLSIGYTIPQYYNYRHMIDILESTSVNGDFSLIGNTRVEYSDPISSVISDNGARGDIFILGESIPRDGIPGEFYLSTSLSPVASNPDNRFVRVFGNKLAEKEFQFRVFNRWGLMVYESNSLGDMITVGWDGRQNGEYLSSGAYPYILKALTKDGEVIEKKGVISVLN